MATTVAEIRARLGLDGKGFTRGLKRAQRDAQRFRRSVNQSFRRLGTGFGVAAGAAGLIGAKFEQGMANVRAVSRASAEDMARLEEKARSLGSTTSFTARESSDAMLILAQAGFKTNQILAATEAVLKGAGAGMTDMTLVAELTTQSIKRFGMQAGEAGRVVNVVQAISQRTQTSFDRMAESMKFAGTVAGPFGLTFEQTAAAVGLLTDRMGDASMAGTGFRRVLAGLVDPANKIHEEVSGLNLVGEGFEETLRKVEAANIPVEKFMTWFGQRGGPAMIQLLAAGADEWARVTEEITGTNAAFEAYEITQNTVQGAFARLRSALEEVAISWNDTFRVRLKEILDAAARSVNENKDRIVGALAAVSEAFFTVGGFVVSMIEFFREHDEVTRTVISTFGILTVATYGLATAQAVLKAVMSANPIVLALTAISAGIAILVEKTGGWAKSWVHIGAAVRTFGADLKRRVAEFNAFLDLIRDGADRAWQSITFVFQGFVEVIRDTFDRIRTMGLSLWELVFHPDRALEAIEDFSLAMEGGLFRAAENWTIAAGRVWEGFGEKQKDAIGEARVEWLRQLAQIQADTEARLAQLDGTAGAAARNAIEEAMARWQALMETIGNTAAITKQETKELTEEVERDALTLEDRMTGVVHRSWNNIVDRTKTGTEKVRALWRGLFEQLWDWIGETIIRWARMQFIMGAARLLTGGVSDLIVSNPTLAGIDAPGIGGPTGPSIGPRPDFAPPAFGGRSAGGSAQLAGGGGGTTVVNHFHGPILAEDELAWSRFLERAKRDTQRLVDPRSRDPVRVGG